MTSAQPNGEGKRKNIGAQDVSHTHTEIQLSLCETLLHALLTAALLAPASLQQRQTSTQMKIAMDTIACWSHPLLLDSNHICIIAAPNLEIYFVLFFFKKDNLGLSPLVSFLVK